MLIGPNEAARITSARMDARVLGGYTLFVDGAPGVEPMTHKAVVVPSLGSNGRFLAYGTSGADAAEIGVTVLEGIVERDEPWPESN